ncbi:MAG: TM2 domain-containing protein [Flavobacteriales bacterium]|nr:TM2 domain-containing protein [Flavobacteriales bacterium]
MILRFFLIYLFLVVGGTLKADDVVGIKALVKVIRVEDFSQQVNNKNKFYIELQSDSIIVGNKNTQVKFKRGKAILFTVFTGLFGGHRIYFGTHQRTPILYSITLGGLGILPLIDLINIIFTKDLSRFENKQEVIMWGR